MSPEWRPDDSSFERNAKGELKGVQRVQDALKKRRVRYGNRVVTSRDRGMDAAKNDLKRTPMPPGIQQWQMPIAMGSAGDVLCFTSEYKRGAKVPSHSHPFVVFRIVMEGSLTHRGVELKAGDWMLVPAGIRYALQAGPKGASIFYAHFPTCACCWWC